MKDMQEKRYKLEIVTPERVLYEGEVTSLRAPGVMGSFEVLIGHIPFLTTLEVGGVSFRETDVRQHIATSGGVLEVLRTGVTVLLETAEWAHEIDPQRAESARQRALQRIYNPAPDIDMQRAESGLARALNRIRIAQRT